MTFKYLHFERLKDTRFEGQEISKILNVLPILGKDASKGKIKELCKSPSIFHIATHGFFLPKSNNFYLIEVGAAAPVSVPPAAASDAESGIDISASAAPGM